MKVSSKYLNVKMANNVKDALETETNIQCRMLLMTNYGFITGNILEFDSEIKTLEDYTEKSQNDSNYFDLNIIQFLKNRFITENKVDIIPNGANFVLKDVKVYHDNFDRKVLDINVMLVHADDIIGISFIPVDTNL